MASRREYEMLFQLNAKLGGNYAKTFRSAQAELVGIQKKIQALSKTQSDIAAFQKQQTAVENTRKKLVMLQQQYDNIQQELQETGNASSELKNKLLSKQRQLGNTTDALEAQSEKLEQLGGALRAAGADTDDLAASSAKLKRQIEDLRAEQDRVVSSIQSFGNQAGQAFSAAYEALAAAGIVTGLQSIMTYFAGCAQAAMDFESAMTGVAKTTDFTDEELVAMSDAIRTMSTQIPATTQELAAIAESAGQLGIHKESLLDFTETMAMLGTATNMTADEAATNLSRLANITGMSQENFGRLGSTIVDLGNNLATTEKEIVDMSMRIAGAGHQVGMTEAQIMAYSGALSSVGIQAEAGGSAFSTLISDMSLAVQQGEGRLEQFAQVAGMSAEQFAQAFETDAAGAILKFIQGLGDLSAQGRSAIAVLDDMELSDISMRDALLRAAGASGTFTEALKTASTAWKDNTALTTEASKRYATAQSQLIMMENAYQNLKAAIGEAYTPALQKAYQVGTQLFNGLAAFAQTNPALVNGFTAFAVVLGVVVAALAAYTVAAKLAAAASAMLSASIPGLNIIMAVTVALAGVTAAAASFATTASEDAVPSVEELTASARELNDTLEEAQSTYQDTTAQTMATADAAKSYLDRLVELESAQSMTEEQTREYNNTVALLLNLMPELSEQIQTNVDDFGNVAYVIDQGAASLYGYVAAYQQAAQQQASSDYLESYRTAYNDAYSEYYKNQIELSKATAQVTELENKRAGLLAQIQPLQEKQNLTQQEQDELYKLLNIDLAGVNRDLSKAYEVQDIYNSAVEESKAVLESAEQGLLDAENAMKNYAAEAENGAGATASTSDQIFALQGLLVNTKEQIDAQAQSYKDAYLAAYDSISGQYALWEEAAPVVATSIGELNTALSSQVDYWQDYNNNLQSLIDRSGEIEGLRDMLSSYADGSQESVNAIAGLAGATDQQLQTMVSNWQALQQEQGKVAGSMADLKTDFNTFVEEMLENLAAKIEAMNLSEEAAESAEQTIQGYINGANSMLPQVQAAYAGLARTARNALSPSGGGLTLNIPGYASGTQRAAPGLALVGEQGPELVYFGGGEQVMTAAETAALQARLSISGGEEALPGTGGSVHLGGVQVVFQITGAPAPEVVEDLRAYGDDFALRVLEVLENAQIDAKRGSMV
ncbi:phage tail tape measure protein [uncultured Flavonifractor sp.]|uniref:phage tail tape measure protein n=1 Tax=uncultured Flavonifractor sp. TaxID=1193534 RepID=UPI002612B473|nr:phage tail tape measure protein [uncultured Flavonifractor sp.]